MNEKNRIAAGVLAILLGGLGIHKFYMGKTGMGILYLVFCWTGIPSLAGLIEGIIYICESDEKFASRLV
ncbi:MAG: TM2 domain-containing protein [Bacteroidales bacterium]|nr:TM2 domain-containing protein [Bacteroidales bacterium]